MKFFKKPSNLVITGILLAAILGAAFFFTQPSAADESAAPVLQTAKVRTGDMVITASGAGTVLPVTQMDLGFRTSGVVSELNVDPGEAVTGEQVLARLEENLQAEADFQALFSADGMAQAELARSTAQVNLDDAILSLKYVLGPDAYYWDTQVKNAETTLATLNADVNAGADQKAEAAKVLEQAHLKYNYFLELNIRALAKDNVFIADADIILARANLESARVALQDAQTARDIIKAGPQSLTAPIASLCAETAKLEQARLAVENTRLVAPFDGSVVALNMVRGQTVGTSPVMTLATTNQLLVRFYLDETDVEKAAAGRQVTFTFDAYPNQTVIGQITMVEPALQIVDGTPVVVVWASLPEEAPFTILSGMTVDAEVIAAEARNTLIVPVQALRELAPGSYAVFLVSPDGQLQMTPVTVGLRDFANAEILSGVEIGDVVSTGTVETK